ncbi:MAG: DoxX family protein [Bacteroidetes bacterium]|nr:DoxX family protein [Bacteroidota bacterium]
MLRKLFSTQILNLNTNIALLLLRIVGAGLMLPHGYKKLLNFTTKQETFMDFMGLGSSVSLSLTIGAEFFCALFVCLGLFTRIALIPLIIAMLVAVFVAHHGEITGDGEHAFLFLVAYSAVFIAGAGKYSLDAILFKSKIAH